MSEMVVGDFLFCLFLFVSIEFKHFLWRSQTAHEMQVQSAWNYTVQQFVFYVVSVFSYFMFCVRKQTKNLFLKKLMKVDDAVNVGDKLHRKYCSMFAGSITNCLLEKLTLIAGAYQGTYCLHWRSDNQPSLIRFLSGLSGISVWRSSIYFATSIYLNFKIVGLEVL